MKSKNSLLTFLIIFSLVFSSFNFQSPAYAESGSLESQLDFLEENIEDHLHNIGVEDLKVTAQLPMSNQTESVDKEILSNPEDESELVTEDMPYEELVSEEEEMLEEIKENFDVLSDEVENLVEENDLVIQISGIDDNGEEFTTSLGLDLGNDTVNLVATEENGEEHTYILDVESLDENNISGSLIDKDTGEEIDIDSEQGEYRTSAVFVPALGITVGASLLAGFAIAVGATVLIYLAAQGLITLYKGALWIAGKVAQEQKNNRRWVHYQARRVNNKHGIFVGPGQSATKATTRLRANLDVWSINSTQAKKVAKAASSYKDTLYHSPHKAKKGVRTFHHYHPKGKSSHSFYGAGRMN